jgi:ketosteroid isomerase-like protein
MPDESPTADLEDSVRRSLGAFARRDFDTVMTLYAPNAVWDAPMGVGVWEGREAIRRLFEDWRGSYQDFDQVIEELRDLGGVTFAVLLQRGRPRGSSGVVAVRLAVVGTWRDGLVDRFTWYTDPNQARAAAERLAEERG